MCGRLCEAGTGWQGGRRKARRVRLVEVEVEVEKSRGDGGGGLCCGEESSTKDGCNMRRGRILLDKSRRGREGEEGRRGMGGVEEEQKVRAGGETPAVRSSSSRRSRVVACVVCVRVWVCTGTELVVRERVLSHTHALAPVFCMGYGFLARASGLGL